MTEKELRVSSVLTALHEIGGLRIVQVSQTDIVTAAFNLRAFPLPWVFGRVCRYLERTQRVRFEEPDMSVVRRRLAPQVARIQPIGFNLWMRFPTKGDELRRRAHAAVELEEWIYRKVPLQEYPRILGTLVHGVLVPAASRLTCVQNVVLH